MPYFLMDMHPLVLSRDNVHICSSKNNELSYGYLITLVTPSLLYGVETWGPSLNKANHWNDLETFSVNDCSHYKKQRISAPRYNPGRDGSSTYNRRGIVPISDIYPTSLGAP